jgi:hypothetical protein
MGSIEHNGHDWPNDYWREKEQREKERGAIDVQRNHHSVTTIGSTHSNGSKE